MGSVADTAISGTVSLRRRCTTISEREGGCRGRQALVFSTASLYKKYDSHVTLYAILLWLEIFLLLSTCHVIRAGISCKYWIQGPTGSAASTRSKLFHTKRREETTSLLGSGISHWYHISQIKRPSVTR